MSNKIRQATSLGLDTEVVTKTAIRLTRLCPSIFVTEGTSGQPMEQQQPRTPSNDSDDDDDKNYHREPPGLEAVSIDEIVDANLPTRKTSPVCVGAASSFDDSHPFLVKAGRHQSHCR